MSDPQTADRIDNDLLPRRRPFSSRTVGNEVMVRDAGSGQVHFLNPSAAVVWECCDGQTSVEECEARLRGQFRIPAETDVVADIQETVRDFAQKGLLE